MRRLVVITLVKGDERFDFDFLHADRLLRHEARIKSIKPNYKGWMIPEEARYLFNGKEIVLKEKIINATFIKPDKRKNRIAKEKRDNFSGDKTSEQA